MLKTRLITALVGIPVILILAYLGGVYWNLFIVALAFFSVYEFYSMAARAGYYPLTIPGYFLTGLILVLFSNIQLASLDIRVILYIVLIFSGIILLASYPRYNLVDLALTWFGALYFGILLSFAMLLAGQLTQPFFALVLVFLLTWASDTGGYFAGRLWGRRKLAPSLSPKKTWEGTLGGLLLALVVAVICLWGQYPAIYIIGLGIGAGVLAQAGDLVVSSMKRHFGVKDSGNLIPGHGGILDRFDSFMWVVPFVYFFFKLI